ncbi:lipoprotein, putative [hydrothermal vent metagenome]|uniref:Lipoprotein, putative n=1 Tax=hydrothermal vent metagenome TaxID=652676 RepID=A0A1W1BRS2_9ZZZZ
MKYLFTSLFSLFFVACSTLSISTDYDTKYNFNNFHSFAVVHKIREGENTLTTERIKNALIKTLKAKNFNEVSAKTADLVFLYHTNVQNKTDIYTDYQMVGYRRYGGMVVSTPRTYSYNEGKLIIDAYNPKTNKIVFRAVAIDELPEKKTPKERENYINKVIAKTLKDFPPQ